jgi:6-phosphogluconolactonase
MTSSFFLGCYTFRPGLENPGRGISLLRLDESDGLLTEAGVTPMKNPSYLWFDRRSDLLLAVTENDENQGAAASFRLAGGVPMEPLSQVEGPGRSNCHILGDGERGLAYTASYGEGRLKVYSLKEGLLGGAVLDHGYEGSGPNRERQAGSHAHQSVLSPDGRFLYVADLGSDRIWIHNPDSLSEPPRPVETPPGLGPRHMIFHPCYKKLYVLCELIPELLVFKWNKQDGSLVLKKRIPTVEEKDRTLAQPAAIKLHPSGKTLAVSNRFADTVSLFDLDKKGRPVNRVIFPSRGKTCRDMEFSPSRQWLLMAHQDSSEITMRRFDPLTGRPLEEWGTTFETGAPTCLVSLS